MHQLLLLCPGLPAPLIMHFSCPVVVCHSQKQHCVDISLQYIVYKLTQDRYNHEHQQCIHQLDVWWQ